MRHTKILRTIGLSIILCTGLLGCVIPTLPPQKPDEPQPAKLILAPVEYGALESWAESDHSTALIAFQSGCGPILSKAPDKPIGGDPVYGLRSDWRQVCETARALKKIDAGAARNFVEKNFQPFEARDNSEPKGLFTGYYEPELRGSRNRRGPYQTPLFARPDDLVMAQLGDWRDTWKGERIAGRVEDGRLVPYHDRAAIVAGALKNKAKPIVYVDNAWEAFSLQVQGSGRIRMNDGTMIRLNFDGQNGHQYTSIGRKMVERGEIAKGKLSMQAIRDWIGANPASANRVMNDNRSYVFFKELPIGNPAEGAPGTAGVPLVSEASMAVDPRFHPMGALLWVNASAPDADTAKPDRTFRHLLVALDTGGAIKGPVRGDVYWGSGPAAEEIAGRMAHRGRMIVFLPRPLAAKIKPAHDKP